MSKFVKNSSNILFTLTIKEKVLKMKCLSYDDKRKGHTGRSLIRYVRCPTPRGHVTVLNRPQDPGKKGRSHNIKRL